jgi:hypothetical protein
MCSRGRQTCDLLRTHILLQYNDWAGCDVRWTCLRIGARGVRVCTPLAPILRQEEDTLSGLKMPLENGRGQE